MGEAGVRLCTQNLSEVLPSRLGCCMEGGSTLWLELHSQLSNLVWLMPPCCILPLASLSMLLECHGDETRN